MAFTIAVVLTLAFELLAPFALVALVAWKLKPRSTFVWATGLWGAVAGFGFFGLVYVTKTIIASTGIEASWQEGASLAWRAAGDAAFASLSEEIVRFAAVLVLFRYAGSSKSPLVAGALFGLGWAGFECVYIGIRAWNDLVPQLAHAEGKDLPFLPLVGAWERTSAIALHVALTAFAVRAAMERDWRLVAAAFAGALAIHFALNWMVGWYSLPMHRAFEHGDYVRALRWLLTMECWFAAGAIGTLSLSSRLKAPS